MAPTRTKTVKNKHAASKTGGKGVKGGKISKNSVPSPVVKSKAPKGKITASQVQGKKASDLIRKPKKRVYTEKELGIPKLNMITPVGVQKPKGKKKGKVFVDDRESMNTILAMVQAEKEGQIESKMMKARQMEEIREARRVEAEKKEAERTATLEETKASLRKKRKRTRGPNENENNINEIAVTGTKAAGAKKKKRVSFADE